MEEYSFVLIIGIVIATISTLISIKKAYNQYQKFSATPYANEALAGCYVKFMGKVVSQDRHKRPHTQQDAAFYQFHVLGYRKIKRKKPQSGFHEFPTNLYSESSGEFVLQDRNNQRVTVALDIPKLEKSSIINIRKETYKSQTLLDGYHYDQSKLNRNYNYYNYTSNYLKQHSVVSVYGRLVKKDNGYIITNTYRKAMPLRIELGDQLSKKVLFYDKVRGKAIFLLINLIALGVIYLS